MLLEPSEENRKVARFKPVQIAAPDAIEAPAFFENLGNLVTVREKDSARNVIGKADEGREFGPGQGRAGGPKLDLVRLELAQA